MASLGCSHHAPIHIRVSFVSLNLDCEFLTGSRHKTSPPSAYISVSIIIVMTCSINKHCILSVSVTILAQILTCEVRFQALPRKFAPVACQSKFASADKFASARKSSPPPSMELDLDVPEDVLKEARDTAMHLLKITT